MKSTLFIAKIIVAVAVFSGFLYVSLATVDPDIWWHLRVGERELQNNSIPHFDEYSFTMSGHRWVNHEWLLDAGLWWTEKHNLWWSAGVVFSMLAFLPAYFWVVRAQSFLELALILAATNFMMNVVGVRPQMITVALFFILFEIIRKRFGGVKNYFWFLPILFFAWANLHGGFAVGLAFLGLSVFTHYAYLIFKKERINFSEVSRGFISILVSVFATLVNPYGIELHKEFYRVLLSSDTAKYIAEWQSALSTYLFSAVVLVSVFIAFALSKDFRKLYPLPLFLGAAAMLGLFIKSVRHGPLFLVLAMPFMLAGADKIEKIVFSSENWRIKTRASAAIFVMLAFSFTAFGYRVFRVENYPYPAGAVEFLKKEQARSGDIHIFNDYGWGGYLVYHAPEIKVFIDGRMPHWVDENGKGAMKDLVKVYFGNDPEAWKEIFYKWEINTVLTASKEKHRTGWLEKYRNFMLQSIYVRKFYNFVVKESAVDLKKSLLENGWNAVYQDDVATVLGCQAGNCYGN